MQQRLSGKGVHRLRLYFQTVCIAYASNFMRAYVYIHVTTLRHIFTHTHTHTMFPFRKMNQPFKMGKSQYWVGQKVCSVFSKNKRPVFHIQQELY